MSKAKLKTMGVAEIRAHLREALRLVEFKGKRVVLQHHRRGVAAIVSMEDLAALETLDAKKAPRARKTSG